MAGKADKLNIAANWRAAASPRIAAIHDDQGRIALLGRKRTLAPSKIYRH